MRLILSQYLKSLKERDEFDDLLPDLLMSMGYVPISRPQTGVRQFGVDLATVGKDDDAMDELLLLVIKQGDISRSTWDSGPQSVRQSLNEVLDVYLRSHVEPAHQNFRKKIVLATTGDLKQDTQPNWDGYVHEHSDKASFEFWGGDKVASLIEQHLLNENIFKDSDRKDLRKALALAGEVNYDQKDLHRLFLRQLGMTNNGNLVAKKITVKNLIKGIRITSLAAQIFSRWSEGEGNLKQALIANERALLWIWHRIQLHLKRNNKLVDEFIFIIRNYYRIADDYFEKIQNQLYVKDALTRYSRENASISLTVFEQIGLIASIGLAHLMVGTARPDRAEAEIKNARTIANGLAVMLRNNPVSGSPRLDENIIDITLGMLLLIHTGFADAAKEWLSELVRRIDYTLKSRRNFPICSDSLEDLVELAVGDDESLVKKLMEVSWMLPSLAGWAVILDQNEVYQALAKNSKTQYPEICMQLWHPTEDLAQHLYFHNACRFSGTAEAPISLPNSMDDYREQMRALLSEQKFDVIASSPGFQTGLGMIDLIACRHFRTPIPPFMVNYFGGLRAKTSESE